jgi:RND family efflux transporter MFP subunit
LERQDLARLKIDRGKKAVTGYSSKRRRRRVLYLVILISMILVGYLVYGQILGSTLSVEIGTVTTAYPSQAFTLLNATGYVVPQIKAEIASKATGRLESLKVEEGSHVTKGQIIARLEKQDVIASLEQAAANAFVARAGVKQAEAELKEASLSLDRAKNLIKKKFITQEVYDAMVARYDKAAAAVNSAEANIAFADAAYKGAKVAFEYTVIRAPFDGVILAKHADVGDIVAPFSSAAQSKGAVVTLADMNTLEVEADVSESNFSKVQIGQPCEVQLDGIPDTRFRCEVNRIVPTVDKSKATVLVNVRFLDRNDRILPNMSARVAFLSQVVTPEQQRPATVVQPSAIVTRNDKQVAFLVHDNTVSEVPVEAGERIGDTVVIKQGLNPGDRVVLRPPEKLRDGSTIRPSQT